MEDDYDIAALLRLNLQDEGYQIVHEADGARARLLLDKQTWDAVYLILCCLMLMGWRFAVISVR